MKNIKKISAILLAMIILALSLPAATVLATDTDMRYGRRTLSQMSNGNTLVAIYDLLEEECAVLNNKIDLPDGVSISKDEMNTVYTMFYSDFPEFFWVMNGEPGYWTLGDKITSIIPIYDDDVTATNIDTMKSQLDSKVSELTDGLNGKSDYEKSKILHDRLCDTTKYVFGSHNQCAYGALVEGYAVCNGYAKAYQYLLKEVGIHAWYVNGDSYNPISDDKVAHAWNVVKLDGNWYYTDVTWDDQDENLYYEYLNITTSQLSENHIIDDKFKDYVPLCTATAANYFVKENRVFSSYNQNELITILKKDNYKSQIYIGGDVNSFKSQFESNFKSIMSELGATRAGYTLSQLHRAIIINLQGDFVCNHSYKNACDADCDLCGTVRTPSPHKYDNNSDTTCNVCGAVRTPNNIPDNWNISITKTGVYNLKPNSNFIGTFNIDSISVSDKNGNEVKFNESKGGFPLVAGQRYTIKFKADCSDKINGDITWTKTSKSNTIFPDTNAGDWYNDAVTYAVGAGIIGGYGNGKFGTSDNIQRQDFLVMLARLDGVELTSYGNMKSKFPDVEEGSYYEAAVNWGAQKGIVGGYDNGKFGTGDKITREQLVTFLHRYATYKGYDDDYSASTERKVKSQYSDYKNVSSFANVPILWAIEKGVIKGKNDTTIAPQGNAQRCEVAQIMYNIYLNDVLK